MSDGPNPNRKNDDFFAAPDDTKQAKPPGAFTKAFLEGLGQQSGITASPTSPDAPADAKESEPSTAQFGKVSGFPLRGEEVREEPTPSPNPEIARPPAPQQFPETFTGMFGSASSAPVPDTARADVTRVIESVATAYSHPFPASPSLQSQTPGGFTERFGSSASIEPADPRIDGARTPSRDFKANQGPAASADFDFVPKPAEPKSAASSELFSTRQPVVTTQPATASNQPGDFTRIMSGAAPSNTQPDRDKTPSRDFFASPQPVQPSSREQTAPAGRESKPAAFTELFSAQKPIASAQAPLPGNQAGEFTRMMSDVTPNTPQLDRERTPSRDFFAPNQISKQSSPLDIPAIGEASKPAAFTELFSAQPPTASAQPPIPGNQAGEFTKMMSGVTPSTPQPDRDRTPSRDFFAPAQPIQQSSRQDISPVGQRNKAGGFTELFSGQKSFATPQPPKPAKHSGEFTRMMSGEAPSTTEPDPDKTPSRDFFALNHPVEQSSRQDVPPVGPASKPGEFTQMISGSNPALRASSAPLAPEENPHGAGRSAATRLFTNADPATSMPQAAGPSEYTRVVSARQLRDLQEGMAGPAGSGAGPRGTAPSSAAPAPGANIAWPNVAFPNAPAMPSPMAVPQPPASAAPFAAPNWQAPQPPAMQSPQFGWQSPAMPTAPPVPKVEAPVPQGESKITKYLPLIIGLNALFLIALLLIVIFALKR